MKINIKNTSKLILAIDNAQKNITARTVTVFDCIDAIKQAEKKLKLLEVSPKYWKDCTIEIKPEKVTNSYKYYASGTYVTIKRFATGWFMIDIGRCESFKRSYGGDRDIILHLSPLAKDNIAGNFKL